MLRVAFDTSPLTGESGFRGEGKYTQQLLDQLKQIPDIKLLTFAAYQSPPPAQAEVIHYPYFHLFGHSLPWRIRRPTVVTVHDVIPLVLKKHYPLGWKAKLKLTRQTLLLKRVKHILTDSQVSRQDIARHLHVKLDKISVVPLAATLAPLLDQNQLSHLQQTYQLPRQFALYVGDVNPNKNLPALIQACQSIKLPLVIVGKAAVKADFDRRHPETQDLVYVQQFAAQHPDQLILTGFVPDEQLPGFYQLASVYVQPSLYEGFGLPVLEAMQAGCLVVCAKTGSLPEIAGQAATFSKPLSADLAHAIQQVLSLPAEEKHRRQQQARQHAQQFSWQQAAKLTSQVYRQVAGKK